jgi:hypothetical protein
LSRDKSRAYTYSCITADLVRWLQKLGLDITQRLHGLRVLGYNLSKRGNGADLTKAHGGWMSEAHDRYERFPEGRQYGIPARMLAAKDVFSREPAPRDIARGRSHRHGPVEVSSDDEPDDSPPEPEAASPNPDVAWLPEGWASREHVTPGGRRYFTFVGPEGQVARSRCAAWRGAVSPGTDDAGGPSYVPLRMDVAYDCDGADGEFAGGATPPVLFDSSSSPVSQGPPSGRRESLVSIARRLSRSPRAVVHDEAPRALPFGASYDYVEVEDTRCGNPDCMVKSVNGEHAGVHVFPPPAPRRR